MNQQPAWREMQPTLVQVLFRLSVDNQVADVRERVVGAGQTDILLALLKEIQFRIDVCIETQCREDQFHYYLLRSYCNLCLEQIREAINAATYAIKGFRMCGNMDAQVYAHWFLGAIYAMQRHGYLYRSEIEHALEIVKMSHQQNLIRGNYDRAHSYELLIQQLQVNHNAAIRMGTGPLVMPDQSPSIAVQPPSSMEPAYMLIPWIPQYQSVRAGNLGNLAAEPPSGTPPGVNSLEIENKIYRLYSVHGTSATDRQISLATQGKYAIALVMGHSMNACSPPICDGDYVLFHLNVAAMDKDIVIASRPADSADYSFMVKRYHHAEKELRSETHDMQEKYPAIKLSADHQILGVVIAVAKKE